MPQEEAIQCMKDAATKSYLKKGQDVVDMNHRAIEAGATAFTQVEVPASWAQAEDDAAQPEIDGGLIGGASLKAPDFTQVVLYNK